MMYFSHSQFQGDWWNVHQLAGSTLASLDSGACPFLVDVAKRRNYVRFQGAALDACDFGDQLKVELARASNGEKVSFIAYSGKTDRFSTLALLSRIKPFLAQYAIILMDNADFAGVYEGIRECLMGEPAYRFHEIALAGEDGARPGQGVALLSFDRSRAAIQDFHDIPPNKNKSRGGNFVPATRIHDLATERDRTDRAVACWQPAGEDAARTIHQALLQEFPDGASPKAYWHDAADKGFTQYFTWGHDQDFGFGLSRSGAMGTRHLEIISESLAYGYLPQDLRGKEVLDIGCWTGGDVLALAGLGASVTALEEHPVSAPAAQRLCNLLGVPATIMRRSLYDDNPEWRGRFDIVYISGVIYHVTDPLLALRICFSYLKPGGRVVVETKASKLEGAYCEYSGILEKGWNWYAPTLETLGRWLVDAGFAQPDIQLHMRPIGRLLGCAIKAKDASLPETAGFSRPASWLEQSC